MSAVKLNTVDIVIIGAGIHGAGVAQAAAAAGYKVLVLEKNSIASGTSSKSSKLIHGGLRYLESYQFSLVKKSLKEREVLCRIAPDLVKLVPFYIPIYKTTSRRPWQVRLGLSLYAILGGLHESNLFKCLRRKKITSLDELNKNNLQKVYRYYDGQTDDKILTQAVISSAEQLGATLVYPVSIESINKQADDFVVSYQENNQKEKVQVQAKIVINATGPWANELLNIVSPQAESLDVDLVQGSHIILDTPAPSGIYYLEASDQRAVFVMPYQFNGEEKTMVGTTEKLFKGKADEVKATDDEVNYLVNLYKNYFPNKINIKVIHQFAGLRVLPNDVGSMFSRPRDTVLHWGLPGLLTLYGGKLTAYRSTSESVLKKIRPFIGSRRRIAFTDQLFLTKNSF